MICRSPVIPGEWPGASADAPFRAASCAPTFCCSGNGLLLRSNPPSWMTMRALRNQMVLEYVEDPVLLLAALKSGHSFVPELLAAGDAMAVEVEQRLRVR